MTQRQSTLVVGLIGGLVLLAPVLVFRVINEDAYISLRMADNLAEGYGYSFDRVERESAASNPLWIGIIAGAKSLARSVPTTTLVSLIEALLVFGTGATVAIVVSSSVASLPWRALLAAATSLMLALSNYGAWGMSGLENALFAALLLAATLAASRRNYFALLIAMSAIVLTRIEGFGYVIGGGGAIAALSAVRRDVRDVARVLLGIVMPALGVFAAAVCLHDWYFGQFMPNSFYLKGNVPVSDVLFGVRYCAQFIRMAPAVLIVLTILWLALLIAGEIRLEPGSACAIGFSCVAFAVATRAGGDYMTDFRLLGWLLPAIATIVLRDTIPVLISFGSRFKSPSRMAILAIGISMIYAAVAQGPELRWLVHQRHGEDRTLTVEFGQALDAAMQDRPYSVGLAIVGAFPYGAKNADVLDPLLLGSHEAIANAHTHKFVKAGHRLGNADFVISKKPDFLMFTLQLRQSTPQEFLAEISDDKWDADATVESISELRRYAVAHYKLTWLPFGKSRLYLFEREPGLLPRPTSE